MDKHCKGCFYQVFKDDTRKIWGFCGYKDIIKECQSKMNPDVDLPNMNGYVKKQLTEMSKIKDSTPPCMFIQTCFGGKCPFYKTEKVATIEIETVDKK